MIDIAESKAFGWSDTQYRVDTFCATVKTAIKIHHMPAVIAWHLELFYSPRPTLGAWYAQSLDGARLIGKVA